MGRLRVLHIGKFYPPHMGGIETHLQTLCERLTNIDLQVLVANDGRDSVEEVVSGVRVNRLATQFAVKSASYCPELVAKIRSTPADIVHLHLPNPTGTIAYLQSRHPGKLVVTYHSDVVKQRILGSLFEPILQTALRKASAILATSPDYLRSSASLQPHKSRCHVVPYGIPLDSFSQPDPAKVASIRQLFGNRLIIGVGRLVYYKGFEYAIRAMRSIDAKLLIAGTGPLKTALEQEIRDCGVQDKVVLLGNIDNSEIAPYYHASKLFAFPSIARSEAFGIVQLEAMMAGLPVVNTSLDSGVPFVSQHGVTGLTVPPMDADAFANAANAILNDDVLHARFSQAARNRVANKFAAERMVTRTLSIYEQVTAQEAYKLAA